MEEKLRKEIIELMEEVQNKDSIELGTSKTGHIKVYCNFNKREDAEFKIKNAIEILKSKRAEVLG